jgi:hypothetical protein
LEIFGGDWNNGKTAVSCSDPVRGPKNHPDRAGKVSLKGQSVAPVEGGLKPDGGLFLSLVGGMDIPLPPWFEINENSEKRKMRRQPTTVQEWFLLNQEELVHCPYQSGNLKITRFSCRNQLRRSKSWAYGGTTNDFVRFSIEKHLEICQRCNLMESGGSDLGQEVQQRPMAGLNN